MKDKEDMTMINLDNYEGYLMRYADGALGDDERKAVEAFLAQHPELQEELDAVADPALHVTPPMAAMPGKERLMRPVAATVPLWRRPATWRVAAAVALLIVVVGMVRSLTSEQGQTPVAENRMPSDAVPTATPSAPIPAPTVLVPPEASTNPRTIRKPLKATGADAVQTSVPPADGKEDSVPVETDSPTLPGSEEATSKPSTEALHDNGIMLIAGRVIMVETDGLVETQPEPDYGPVHNRPDVIRGAVVESEFLASTSGQSLVERAVNRFRSWLPHNRRESRQTLAIL